MPPRRRPGVSIHRKILRTGVSWQVQWRDNTGQQRSKRFHTRRDAEAFQSQIRLNKYQGLLPRNEGTKITFGEYANRWIQKKNSVTKGHKVDSPRTIKRRNEILRLHLLPVFGDQMLASITTAQVNDLIYAWQKAGLKPRTIRNHIYVLRPILKLAVSEQLISRNPIDGVSLPIPLAVIRQALTEEEVVKLINEIPADYKAFVINGFITGMRFDELSSLRIRNVDSVTKSLYVEESKTPSGIRTIYLSDKEFAYLEQHLLTERHDAGPDDFVFVTHDKGKKIENSNFIKRVFKPAALRAGVPAVRPHDMRRTHATFLAEAGLDQTTVHVRMGHSSFSTTQKYYIAPTERGQVKAAGVVSGLLGIDLTSDSAQQ